MPYNLASLAIRLELQSPEMGIDLYWLDRQRELLGRERPSIPLPSTRRGLFTVSAVDLTILIVAVWAMVARPRAEMRRRCA